MLEAIILAGGLGTRLKSTVPDVPKPMAPINGRPFLEYQMDYWITQGVRRFIVSLGKKHHIIYNHFGNHYHGAEIEYAFEEQPRGTAIGLLEALTYVQSHDFLLLNGDTYFTLDLQTLIDFHHQQQADITLALYNILDNTRYMGIICDDDGRINQFNARPKANQLINGGVYLINKNLLSNYPAPPTETLSLENELLPNLLKQQKCLFGKPLSGQFIDIGIPLDYHRAPEIITDAIS